MIIKKTRDGEGREEHEGRREERARCPRGCVEEMVGAAAEGVRERLRE
jgi:hypothetical protein